jgi:hypothetical protein
VDECKARPPPFSPPSTAEVPGVAGRQGLSVINSDLGFRVSGFRVLGFYTRSIFTSKLTVCSCCIRLRGYVGESVGAVVGLAGNASHVMGR